ncbi:MAG: metal-sensing transcriptional repressor [Oscillospiraceae bacterium]|nr:metal-sensing transcriptional repressor [Oscillospiraceae bacterium]
MHGHDHGHTHSHEHTQAVSNRLARAIGHLEAVKHMVEDGRDCAEVLVQLAAVRSALSAVGRMILKDHIEHCIVDAVENDDTEAIRELNRAIDQLLK